MAEIRIKRVYEAPADDDGFRVLVDRLWPRGISKENAALSDWWKDIAPTPELRKWFGHDPEKFPEFEQRYRAELAGSGALDGLRAVLREHPDATLLFAAHDEEHNNAVVLKELLAE